MIFAKKSFGQHFLRDQSVLEKIVAAGAIQAEDIVVEIGPGRGALTEHLAFLGNRLILVEADRELIPDLETRFPLAKIVQADAAHVDYTELIGARAKEIGSKGTDWILIGNLPYNAGNAIIRQALTAQVPPKRQVVMLQREVGEKMLAKPGDMSILSVAVQVYADVKRVATVKPGAFVPPPKVDSIVLALTPNVKADNPEAVIGVAKLAFAHKRKQMHRTLSDAGFGTSEVLKSKLLALGLSEHARPEELSIEQWIALAV
ncbi:MAG TPA: 16S rRNA (adenine(1518)-N(6)/adenine(1519)-N(6))-dimethyltransferase RsmA [bacterium]|nr:16S rRNA (adenine(1518)-N(6)/adenine(1519)-N(6))-dimethyltransferase RsmA [bacterium]